MLAALKVCCVGGSLVLKIKTALKIGYPDRARESVWVSWHSDDGRRVLKLLLYSTKTCLSWHVGQRMSRALRLVEDRTLRQRLVFSKFSKSQNSGEGVDTLSEVRHPR